MASASHCRRQTDHRGLVRPWRAGFQGRVRPSLTIGCCPALRRCCCRGWPFWDCSRLKPNRCAGGWLIWLPLGCVFAFTLALPPILPAGTRLFSWMSSPRWPSGWPPSGCCQIICGGNIACSRSLCVLLALAGFSAAGRRGQTRPGPAGKRIACKSAFVLAIGVLASTVALSLGGLICRSRYRPLGLYLWLLILLAGVWLVIAAPFFLFAVIASGGNGFRGANFLFPFSRWRRSILRCCCRS